MNMTSRQVFSFLYRRERNQSRWGKGLTPLPLPYYLVVQPPQEVRFPSPAMQRALRIAMGEPSRSSAEVQAERKAYATWMRHFRDRVPPKWLWEDYLNARKWHGHLTLAGFTVGRHRGVI